MLSDILSDPIGDLVDLFAEFLVGFVGGWLIIGVFGYVIGVIQEKLHHYHPPALRMR